jgi:hypothetical protein
MQLGETEKENKNMQREKNFYLFMIYILMPSLSQIISNCAIIE